MSQRDSIIHLIAGGVGGTVGAIVTCPLEVVKTRLQSSQNHFEAAFPQEAATDTNKGTCRTIPSEHQRRRLWTACQQSRPQVVALSGYPPHHAQTQSPTILQCIRLIVQHEGPLALFKGLGPNLIGVAPSRAIYFATYSQSKQFWNKMFPPDSPVVHVCSASCAGFSASTLTNPIWFIKTRLQLNTNNQNKMTALQCVQRIYKKSGILGFYKGITASYMGILETIIHFVIYESLKAKLIAHRGTHPDERSTKDFLEFMMAGAISKTIASCIAYPHEVARTRLREEGSKYTGFWQTLGLVFKEEGTRGVYRGLTTQLVRQIPNTAIMMATYEAVVYILTTRLATEFYEEE